MTVEKEKELTVGQETALATQQTTSLFGKGLEEVDMKDIMLPVALVVQKMSPMLDDPDFPHKPGAFIHSILLEALNMPFVPIRVYKDNRFDLPIDAKKAEPIITQFGIVEEMMHNPNKGCVCYAPDGKTGTLYGDCASCGKSEWHKDEQPVCSKRLNVVALFDGFDFPVVIRFGKTSLKHGKNLVSAMAMSGGDIFTRKYKMSVLSASNGTNSWFEVKAKPFGKVEEAELPKYEKWFNTLTQSNIIVEEPEQEEATSSGETEY